MRKKLPTVSCQRQLVSVGGHVPVNIKSSLLLNNHPVKNSLVSFFFSIWNSFDFHRSQHIIYCLFYHHFKAFQLQVCFLIICLDGKCHQRLNGLLMILMNINIDDINSLMNQTDSVSERKVNVVIVRRSELCCYNTLSADDLFLSSLIWCVENY